VVLGAAVADEDLAADPVDHLVTKAPSAGLSIAVVDVTTPNRA
jgi:hypothetical protein